MTLLFEVVPNVACTVVNGLRNLYVLCLWIGWAITTFVVGVLKAFAFVGNNVFLGLSVLCEEFLLFVEDVGEVVENLLLTDIISEPFACLTRATHTMAHSIPAMPNFPRLDVSVPSGLVLVRDAILLLGYCLWEAFAFLFRVLSYLNGVPYIFVLIVARLVDSAISSVVLAVETYWVRSVCGLLLGGFGYFLAKENNLLPDGELWRRMNLQGITFSVLSYLGGMVNRGGRYLASVISGKGRIAVREVVSRTPTKAGLKIRLEQMTAASQCVVCMDRRRDVIIMNCRHLVTCRQCALVISINPGECPVCRRPIANLLSVYT